MNKIICSLFHRKYHKIYWFEFAKFFFECLKCNRRWATKRKWGELPKLLFLSCLFANLHAAEVNLIWNRNPETNIIAYLPYWGPQPGHYDHATNAGIATNITISVPDTQRWYFAVTASNSLHLESLPSNEVYYDPLHPVYTLAVVYSNSVPVLTNVVDIYAVSNAQLTARLFVRMDGPTPHLPWLKVTVPTQKATLRLRAPPSPVGVAPLLSPKMKGNL